MCKFNFNLDKFQIEVYYKNYITTKYLKTFLKAVNGHIDNQVGSAFLALCDLLTLLIYQWFLSLQQNCETLWERELWFSSPVALWYFLCAIKVFWMRPIYLMEWYLKCFQKSINTIPFVHLDPHILTKIEQFVFNNSVIALKSFQTMHLI